MTTQQTFEHFDPSVPVELAQHMLDFIEYAKDNFISEFTDSYASASIDTRSYLYHLHQGGYTVTEQYRNDVDPCSHFTKEQTTWKDKQAAQSLVDFCKHYGIDTDTALSEEYEDKLVEWEGDLHEAAILELVCKYRMEEIQIELWLDYGIGGGLQEQLYQKDFEVEKFMELEFEGFFEELIKFVNELG